MARPTVPEESPSDRGVPEGFAGGRRVILEFDLADRDETYLRAAKAERRSAGDRIEDARHHLGLVVRHSIDEDTVADAERRHGAEQVSYLVFATPFAYEAPGAASCVIWRWETPIPLVKA